MIENKEEYLKKCSEIRGRQEELNDKIEAVDTVKAMLEAYNCNIEDLKERLEEERDAATDEYQAHTREAIEILTKINKEFDARQIEQLYARGYDNVDLVNAYLRGDLDRFKETQ